MPNTHLVHIPAAAGERRPKEAFRWQGKEPAQSACGRGHPTELVVHHVNASGNGKPALQGEHLLCFCWGNLHASRVWLKAKRLPWHAAQPSACPVYSLLVPSTMTLAVSCRSELGAGWHCCAPSWALPTARPQSWNGRPSSAQSCEHSAACCLALKVLMPHPKFTCASCLCCEHSVTGCLAS